LVCQASDSSGPPNARRAGAADAVSQEFERDGVANGEVIDGASVLHVRAMKVDIAIRRTADEPESLADA
jgi:hypothetical protein